LYSVCPEPLLMEKLLIKITTKSQIEFRQARTKVQQCKLSMCQPQAPLASNIFVGGSFSAMHL
jgi:hypothetical protein